MKTAYLPRASPSLPYLGLRHERSLLIQTRATTDGSSDLELSRGDHVQLGIKGHLEVVLLVTSENPLERLLEDHVAERVSLYNRSSGLLNAGLHLVHTALIQSACEDVNHMPVLHAPLRNAIVKLGRFLCPLHRVIVNVRVATHGLLLLHPHNLPRSLGARATQEHHDSAGIVGVAALQKARSDCKRCPRAAKRTVLDLDWPGVVLQPLKDPSEGELALAVRLNEPSDHVWVCTLHTPRPQAEEVLYDLRINIFGPSENITLGHLLARDLVHLHGSTEGDEPDPSILGDQVESHQEGVLKGHELLLLHAGVHDQ
mmetsp:Transcript_11657/g.40245  ORF Transcript_11657/g.40245 Transcript_11657/m.40245 type:complete len:314 (-) Transcript_11657:449-1390(-)